MADKIPTLENDQSKLITLGMIASGVAHDFNNVLTGILGHVAYLRSILPAHGSHVTSLDALGEGAQKAAGLTQQILNFSRTGVNEAPQSVEVCALVRSTMALMRAALPPGIKVKLDLPKDEGLFVLCVESRVTQIIINLVINSRDAIGSQGSIELSVAVVDDAKLLAQVFGEADRASKEYLCFSVKDSGHGMTEDVRRKIFEPYFSTKKALGTGLGLATVLESVHQIGGAIVVDSIVNKGTTMEVYLPLTARRSFAAKQSPAQTSPGPSKTVAGAARILVVDDEYSIRNVLNLGLQHLGYNVDLAMSGKEAVEKYRATPNEYDLVLLDMLMPDMGGDVVFAALKELDPKVKVMVVSGFASQEALDAVLEHGGLDYLPKPFTMEELATKVRQCLDA